MKARKIKDGYAVELTEEEGRDLYQFMALKKAMGNLDVESPNDALGLVIAVQVEREIHKPKEKSK